MNRRQALRFGATVIVGTVATQLAGCGSISSPTNPSDHENPTSPPLPSNTPAVTIDTSKVGNRKFSTVSPISGNLYYDVLPQIKTLIIATRRYERDRVTGTPLNGFAVIYVNGDLGPEFTNALGEKVHTGWVIGIGNQHGFYDSIMDVNVNKGDQIDFYYGLPCSKPDAC